VRRRGCRDRYAGLYRWHVVVIIVGDCVFDVVLETAAVRRFATIVDLHLMIGKNSCKRFSGAFAVILVAKSVPSPIDVGFCWEL
jgi:hypothetical protein